MTPATLREAEVLRRAFILGAIWREDSLVRPTADDIQRAAVEAYPTPHQIEYHTAEDPEHTGWYWRVKDGQLQVNFIHESMDEEWEDYNIAHTPGLTPTAQRCAVWSKLFAEPSHLVPIP